MANGIKATQLTSPLSLKGVKPIYTQDEQTQKADTRHYEYSINNNPPKTTTVYGATLAEPALLPTPSVLDKDGIRQIQTSPGSIYANIAPEDVGGTRIGGLSAPNAQ